MSKIERGILDACSDTAKTATGLLQALGYRSRTGNFKKAISRLLDAGFLEMTIPGKPRSKKQKYRLTDKGRGVLTGQKEVASE